MKLYVCAFLSANKKQTQTNTNLKSDLFRDPGSPCGCSNSRTGMRPEGEHVARAAG